LRSSTGSWGAPDERMRFFPKSRARVRREASDWVVRLAEPTGVEDHAAYRQWCEADPRHGEAYDRIAGIWNQAARLSRMPVARDLRPDALPRRTRAFRPALAASLAAAALVMVLLLGLRLLSGPAQEPMLFAAAVGEIRRIDLPDGSRLTLDSASSVEVNFTFAGRDLTLREGRARFRVAHEARPFAVRAGGSEVVATGTLFDVSLVGGRTTVLLLEGSVEVRGGERRGEIERLKPGEKLTLAVSAPARRQPVVRGEAVWPTGMLEFNNSRLDEAAALANRYSLAQLRPGDERIAGLRVTGAFRAGDTGGFARSLAEAFDLKVERQPDGNLLLVDADPAGPPPPR
jgi:transmembrane sensor